MNSRLRLSLVAACVLALSIPLHAEDPQTGANWPQFRGPGARGIAEGSKFPDHWSATDSIAWKTDIAGRGWSSPVVWGKRVFLTTVVNRGDSEPPKKGLYFGGNRPEPSKAIHEWKVICLDLETGNIAWERVVHQSAPEAPIHLKNSYASETPVTDGERVYASFGNVGVFALDFSGSLVWSNNITPQPTRFGWGTSASPVLHGDRLYLVNDNDRESWLLALDKRTGRQIWRDPRDEKSNWATPFVWDNGKRTEIVTPGTGQVRSYDLEGRLLWSFRGMSSITIATPFADGGLLYVSSGYIGDQARPLYAIRPGAAGDISLKAGERTNEFIAWSHPQAAPYNPSTLVYGGRLYVLYDRGLVSCYDAKTGEMRYDRERLPDGFAFTSSPWAADGKIYCLNEDGICFVLRAGDKFELLHTNRLANDDMCMATPAVVGNRLLIRTGTRVYCVERKP